MALTVAETAELTSLQAALFALRTGQLPSKVVYNGKETDFAKVDLVDLRQRVDDLVTKQGQPASSRPFRSRGRFRIRV